MRPSLAQASVTLSLFTSFSTLICCALPALFVALGLGATLAGIVNAVPQLIWLSAHKTSVFLFAGIFIAGAGLLLYGARNAPCPVDPALARQCMRLRRFSVLVYGVSVALFLIGLFFAYGAVYVL